MRGQRTDVSIKETNWSSLKLLIPYLLQYKWRVLLALLFLIAAKVANVYLPFVLKHIVDHISATDDLGSIIALPLGLLLAYGTMRLANVLFGEIRDTIFGRVTEGAMHTIGLQVFKHMHALDLDFHLNRRTGGLSRDIERGIKGISFLLRFMVFNIAPTLIEIGMVIILLLLNYDAVFALIVALAVIGYVAFSIFATERRTRFVREVNIAESNSSSRSVDSLLNYETVKYFTNENYEAEHYDKELAIWEQARRKNRLSLFVLNGGQAFIIAAAATMAMIFAAKGVLNKTMTLGDFVLINAFIMQIFLPLNFLGFVYREMKGSMANIEKLFDIRNTQPSITDKKNAPPLKIKQGMIEFNHIQFAYNNERTILNDISFNIKANQKVAIVGSSGSGKSTLFKCLFRFYDVNQGSIYIDGQNIQDVTQRSLRQAIGVVPQDTVLFNTSIIDNIRYGRVDASDADIFEAITLAHLNDFIQQLPKGVDTLVGERGLKLSGGEKQRVAIARAILKNPPIMVFDEATSSLDSNAEKLILQAINTISRRQTSLVIAHRLSTVVDADNIIVLDHGKIIEQGNHETLLALKGHYSQLWQIQQKQPKTLS